MDSDVSDFENTPPEIKEQADLFCQNLLPAISREKYEAAYRNFMEWRSQQKTKSFSENVLMVYIEGLSNTRKASTIWSIYSMLKSTINIKHGIDISTYPKLRALLKRKSEGHTPKKSKTLTPDDINRFLIEAPDNEYLLTKVNLKGFILLNNFL